MQRVATYAAGVLLMAASMLLGQGALATNDLSQQEDEGRALFLTGRIGGPPPYALVGAGDVKVPATAVPCSSCHGHDGRGRAEQGIVPPNITWPALSAPDTGTGHQRPPYRETSVIRAITMGIDAGGNRLDPIMPRFQLTSADAAALLAYLKRLGTLPQPGLDDHALVLGTVLDEPDAAVGAVLSAYLDEVNQDGGVFGRRLELRIEHLAALEAPDHAIARLLGSDAIFAVLAPAIAGDERNAVAAADAGEVPIIGPSTPTTQAAPRSRYVFYLDGGVEAEARALAGFAATLPGSPLIVDDGTPPWHAAAVAAAETLPAAGGTPTYRTNQGPLLWFAVRKPDENDLAARSAILLPGALAGDTLPHGTPLPTWTAFAAEPPDAMQGTAADHGALAARRALPPVDQPSQRHAIAAAKILIEALRRAGRDVTRERLVDALETLQDFHTGLVPPVSYSATRRIGSDGAWLVPSAGGHPIWWDR
jgi:ABC-type branched-subunit amino acid transport system substrate-binding protein